jgi:hypothetical protein
MMSGKLATLTRLHKWRLDEERRGLAEAMRELDLRESALRELEAEIVSEQESARTGPGGRRYRLRSLRPPGGTTPSVVSRGDRDGRSRGVSATGPGAEPLP